MFVPGRNQSLRLSHGERDGERDGETSALLFRSRRFHDKSEEKKQRWLLRRQVEQAPNPVTPQLRSIVLALAAANVVHSLCTVTNADTSSASLLVTCIFKI